MSLPLRFVISCNPRIMIVVLCAFTLLQMLFVALCSFQVHTNAVESFDRNIIRTHGSDELENTPKMSIIIITYKRHDLFRALLQSISRQETKFSYEVVVMDNGCYDETKDILRDIFPSRQSLKYIPLCDNSHCAVANNRGAEEASSTSSWLLFLNDDLVLMDGFLQYMMDLTIYKANVGGVGCKLTTADGATLLEAGSVVLQGGDTHAYGRGDDPSRPQYSYTRPVDYISGACLLVNKADFIDYGRFDHARYMNYYADTDLCMGIFHELGKWIWYQPLAVAHHQEHASFGSNITALLMWEQGLVFQEKWSKQLQTHWPFTSTFDSVLLKARDKRNKGLNILFVDQILPRRKFTKPFEDLVALSENLGHKVTLIAAEELIISPSHQKDLMALQQASIEVITELLDEGNTSGSSNKIVNHLNSRPDFYQAIIINSPRTKKIYGPDLASYCKVYSCKVMYEIEDPFSLS